MYRYISNKEIYVFRLRRKSLKKRLKSINEKRIKTNKNLSKFSKPLSTNKRLP